MGNNLLVQAVEVFAALTLYFLPSILADRRKRRDVLTIALFNAVMGWTVFGWLLALYWSLQPNPPENVAVDVTEKRRLLSMGRFSRALAERVSTRVRRTAARDRAQK
ncbi:superinfection immunity protein [Paraburkholderia sp. A1RI_3L]|uniref:superinfection immunity protein n=1 Tax=Paraburkholderia TaxID=1822464 RepID=UPI00034B6B98|nr:superinfection immunity protein [Paraburkholderia kururiensis]